MLVCATARLTAQNIAFSKVARHAILDPRRDGRRAHDGPHHLRLRGVAAAQVRPRAPAPDAAMTLTSDFEVEHYLDYQAEIFLERFDPHSYLYLSRVMDYYEPFAEADVRTPSTRFLLVSFDSDWRFGTEHSEFIAERAVRARRRRAPPRGRLAVGPRLVPDGRPRVPRPCAISCIRRCSSALYAGDACHRALRDPPRRPLRFLLGPARLPPARRHAGARCSSSRRSTASGPATRR